jgi:hypothetical protein
MKLTPPVFPRPWLVVLACLALGSTAHADLPPQFKLPQSDGEAWVKQVQTAIGRKNWSVTLKGNDITIRRAEPVEMERVLPNAPPDAKPIPDGQKPLRLVLRFNRKMSLADYEKFARLDRESIKEYERLRDAVGLPYKFDQFIATTPEEQERVKKFESEAALLPRYTVPDLYTPDHSIDLLHSWDDFSYPADREVAAECRDVQERLLRLFGMYDPAAAADNGTVGTYLGEPDR